MLKTTITIYFIFTISIYCQTLTSIYPSSQRVHEYIELHGSGFGTTQGASLVRFTDGTEVWDGGKAYVWRDNFIRIRVPVGKLDGGAVVPISKGMLEVYVETSAGISGALSFQITTITTGSLEFRQLTEISGDQDISTVLGSPNLNYARSKDADLADVNGDGFMDILDNNSSNIENNSHGVIHINNQDKTFTAIALEKLESSETGSFATTPTGGDYIGDETSYDADMFDINNDRLPDVLQTASKNPVPLDGNHNPRIRILVNDPANPGAFFEETVARLALGSLGTIGCPDDIDHADVNNDGWLDFLVTMRTAPAHCPGNTSVTQVFINRGGGNYDTPQSLSAPANISTHDAFFIDANDDGFEDIVLCNEYPFASAFSQLFLHDGSSSDTPYSPDVFFSVDATTNAHASTGAAADFNGDGLLDFVLAHDDVHLFLNDPDNPGDFMNIPGTAGYDATKPVNPTTLPAGSGSPFYYDIESGDIDLDGDVDVVAASLRPFTESNVQVWLNNGSGVFTNATPTSSHDLLPGNMAYQWLSSDLLDFDMDGDLDLYVSGADGTGVGPDPGFGKVPNLLFENLLIGLDIVKPRQPQPAYAGSATGGRKVLVILRNNLPISGPAPSDFVISVDGTALDPSATVTGAQIEAEYWLLVQMPAKPNGCYSLEVSLVSDPVIKAVELDALCYNDDRLFDRAVAIDRTTSMLYNSVTEVYETEKLDAARAAGNFFVNLSEDNDRIGVTSFNRNLDDGDGVTEQHEMARTDWAMTPAFESPTMTDNRINAISAINSIYPDGTYFPYQTTIGAGLKEAWTEIQDEGDIDHEWEIVLLSDGIENYAPFWSEVEPGPPLVLPIKPDIVSADPHVTVHTVAVGQDADTPLLMDIASSTGGQFFNLYEGTGSFGLISRLASVYKYIDEEMRDEQRFFYREDVPDPVYYTDPDYAEIPDSIKQGRKSVRVDSFYVPTGFESITVGFHWNRNYAISQAVLFDPMFSVVLPSPPVRTIQTNPKHKTYRIRDPRPGWYYYRIDLGTESPFEFFVTASGITDLLAKARPGNVREVSPGNFEIPIRVIVGDFEPVRFASISGDVVLPDKTRIPITLYDDGSHEDGIGNDAIYSQVFAHTMPGGYTAELVTTGISNRNEPFTRYSILSWAFPGANQDPDEPVNDGEPRDTTGRDVALSFHVGSSHPLSKFDERADANIHLRIDASYPLRKNLRVLMLLGFSQFTADYSTGLDNEWWSNASINLQNNFSTSTEMSYYIQGGAGIYKPKSGSSASGLNVGFGGRLPLASGPFTVEFGLDYHRIFEDRNVNFATAQLGVVWRGK